MDSTTLTNDLHYWARNASNASATVQTALRIGIFDALPVSGAAAGLDRAELAKAVGASFRGVRAVAELLVAWGNLVLDDQGRLTVHPETAAFLSNAAARAELDEARSWWGPVGRLDEALRSGEPIVHEGRAWDVLERYRQLFDAPAPETTPAGQRLFDRAVRDFLRTRAIISAGELGILAALAEQAVTASALAASCSLHPSATRTLLTVLGRMGLVSAEGESWRLTDAAQGVLGSKALPYFLRTLPVTALYWEALERLEETVRREHFVLDLKDPVVSARFYTGNAQQISSIFASHFQLSRKTARALHQVRSLEGAAVLDVGTGSGVWGAAFAATERTAKVTFFDQPEVLEQAKTNLERLKLTPQAIFRPGNCLVDDLGTDLYDVVVLPQVCNVLLPDQLRSLLTRAARALKAGGTLAIVEYILSDRRDGPVDYLYFGLRRFMTHEGDLLSVPEYAEILSELGLAQVRAYPLPAQEVLLAARPGTVFPQSLSGQV